MDKQKLEEARQLAISMTSHPVAFGTIEHTEQAGELLGLLWKEVQRLRAENAALKHDLQYARDGLTKGRTRMREDNERLRAALTTVVRDWTAQFERNGHHAPAWVRQAREALGPNAKLCGPGREEVR